MYPFEAGLDFVRNAWYAAGWSTDFGEALTERRYLDEPVVMFRASTGEVVALADRCAHRAYPLSCGARAGDTIVCGYHGFTYDTTGRCVAIPSQDRVPATYAVRRYPTLERAGLVWIWMGGAERADEALMPDLSELGFTHPDYLPASGGTYFCNNRYQLSHENLLDLSHIGFLHPGSIGTPHVAASPVETRSDGRIIEATRTIYNDEATPFHLISLGITGPMDRTTRSVFFAPCAHVTHVTHVAPGSTARIGEPGYLGEFRIVHMITPVTANESWYFWAFNRTVKRDDETTAAMRAAFTQVFNQDRVALARQEQRLIEDPEFREVSCKADEAPLKARRTLAVMMREERSLETAGAR